MKFNKVIRGAKREMNDIENIHAILDAGFFVSYSVSTSRANHDDSYSIWEI
jgi:hypothetical protein